jgi:hypothetical protein
MACPARDARYYLRPMTGPFGLERIPVYLTAEQNSGRVDGA